MRCIRGELSRLNWGHPRKNPSKKFGCDTSCKFVTRLGKDLQYSPSLVPACTWSRSNFSDEVFFLGCRNLWMVCVKIRRCIKGEESSPPLQPRLHPYSRSLREHNHSPPRPGLEPAPDSFRGYPHCGLQTPARNAWLTAKMSEKVKCYGKPLEKSYWIVDLKMIISYITYRGLLW